MSRPLSDRIAVVTGASRGIGKGAALALGDAGATVYVTGRTLQEGAAPLPGTIGQTAAEVDARGGRGIAVQCDHADDDQVRALFERVQAEQGRVDILVNNVFALPDSEQLFGTPFWEQPLSFWDTMHRVGLRSHYVASALAAPMMVERGRGLIANISSFGAARYAVNVAYGVGKAGVERLTADTAHELKRHGVAVVTLWPGVVRTERILALGEDSPFDMSVTESPELTGRAVVALACDDAVLEHTGKRRIVAELAEQYDFVDIDGTRPRSLRSPRPK